MGENVLENAVNRRAVLQTLLGGAGAGLALPGLTEAHPIHEHLRDQARVATAQKKAAAAASAGRHEFLDAHQFETLTVLAEQIVPGSTKASSAAFIDALLSVETEPRRRRFVEALNAFDGLALAKAKKPWTSLPESDRTSLLTMASTAASGLAPEGGAEAFARRSSPGGPAAAAPAPTLTVRDHFDQLKGWISGAYYSSEIGMRELGWTGTVMHESFPGCTHGTH